MNNKAQMSGRRSKPAERFHLIDLPRLPKYFQIRREEGRLLNDIRTLCFNPKDGVLAIKGTSGAGKTSMLAQLFVDESNQRILMQECCVNSVIWVNCCQWHQQDSFGRDQQNCLAARLIKAGQRLVPQNDHFAKFYDVKQMIDYLRTKHHRRVIFVLDDVSNTKLIEFMVLQSPDLICCAILQQPPAETISSRLQTAAIAKIFVVEPLPEEAVANLFLGLYGLKGKLKDPHIKELSRYCFGNHLYASQLASRINDSTDPEKEFEKAVSICKTVINPTVSGMIRYQFDINLKKLDQLFQRNLHAFLLYGPGELVSLDELVILWGFTGDIDAKERALQFCNFFEKKGFVRRAVLVSTPSANKKDIEQLDHQLFVVHSLIYDGILETAKKLYPFGRNEPDNDKFISQLRMQIASGSCCTEGSNVKTAIDILCQCVMLQRRRLLEKIVASLEVDDISSLFRIKSQLSEQKTFLHFLYDSSWNDDILLTDKICEAKSVNNSYRLIAMILRKLKQGGVDCDPIVNEDIFVSGEGSLLLSVMDDWKNKQEYKTERQPIFKMIQHLRHRYDELAWRKKMMDRKLPILAAIFRSDKKAISELVQRGDLCCNNNQEQMSAAENIGMLVMTAARANSLDALRCFCERFGKDILLYSDEDFNSAFSLACRNGHVDVLKYLLVNDPESVHWRHPRSGMTAIMLAAMNGHVEAVKALFERNPDGISATMDARFGNYTALGLAAMNGHLETVTFLVEKYPGGVAINEEENAVTIAAEAGYVDIVKFLSEKFPALVADSNGWKALSVALLNGQSDVAKLLLSQHPKLARLFCQGDWSPLMLAAANCDLETVKFIYELYPEAIHMPDRTGSTALMTAVTNSKLDVVIFLYDKFPDAAKLRDESGHTPLALAAQGSCLHIVQFLYEKYPDAIKIVNRCEETPLQRAACSQVDQLEIVKFLHGKYPNAVKMRNIYGVTPLMHAAFTNTFEIVKFLVEMYPESVNDEDNGKKALDYARANARPNQDVINFLSSKTRTSSSL